MKGWKTIVLAILVSTLGLFQFFSTEGVIAPNIVGPIITIIGIAIGVLRALTTSAIFKK